MNLTEEAGSVVYLHKAVGERIISLHFSVALQLSDISRLMYIFNQCTVPVDLLLLVLKVLYNDHSHTLAIPATSVLFQV